MRVRIVAPAILVLGGLAMLGAAASAAEPTRLTEQQLDHVTAGATAGSGGIGGAFATGSLLAMSGGKFNFQANGSGGAQGNVGSPTVVTSSGYIYSYGVGVGEGATGGAATAGDAEGDITRVRTLTLAGGGRYYGYGVSATVPVGIGLGL